jgi:Tol biopolymer transport system component
MKKLNVLVFVTVLALLAAACSASEGALPTTSSTTTTVGTTSSTTTTVGTPAEAGGRLLFSRFVESTHTFAGMFTSRPDGTDETEVPLPGPEGGGRWSRSGTEIAVMTVLDDGRIGTAVISEDGTVLRVLEIPDPTLSVSCTIWSRDDTRLACEGWDDTDASRRGIYTVNSSDGGGLERLTAPPAGMGDLPGDFSPDGRLVFKRYNGDEGPGPLMLVDANGGEPQALTENWMEDPGRFSPDGQSVATSADGHLEVIDLDGNVLYRIAEDGAHLFGPAWSPDGTRIAFSRGTTGPFADLYTSLPDGTDRRQVTSTADNEIGVDWGVSPG